LSNVEYNELFTTQLALVSLTLAFAIEIARFIVDTLGGGEGDWDPVRNGQVHSSHMLTVP
jgi:hypothetical protein